MEYTWRVWKNCRIVGYLSACSEIYAVRKAEEKYGKQIWVERIYVETEQPAT